MRGRSGEGVLGPPGKRTHTHYGGWHGLTTTAQVRNQEETQISHFQSRHFRDDHKNNATFDTTTYHVWQLSEETAVSTPRQQRVQNPCILGPSLTSQGRNMGQQRASKGCISSYANAYSAHQSACLTWYRTPPASELFLGR